MVMVADEQLARSKRIQQRTGRTFHFATRLLPERIRHPTYVLYAFFRVADEVVDDPDPAPPAEQRARLERLRDVALGRTDADESAETDAADLADAADSADSSGPPEDPSAAADDDDGDVAGVDAAAGATSADVDPVVSAFSAVREEYGIADEDVDVFVDAMLSDIETDRYETYDELEAYMDGSAAAVGRMMTAVMDPELPEQARTHATALGEAFQLTNFVRDVREDIVERDRVYLPEETLDRYGVTADQLRRFEFDDDVAAAIRHETQRAEELYKEGVAGIQYLPADCRFAVLLSAVLYAEHHRLVRRRGYDTLTATPQLGAVRKTVLLARTWWAWIRTKDPEAVFRSVSCVPYGDHAHADTRHSDTSPAR